MSTEGQILANHIAETRRKYGKYPAVDRVWDAKRGKVVEKAAKALPGEHHVKVEPLPDRSKLSKVEKFFLAGNRKDYRQRIRPMLKRETRKLCYSGELHHRINAMRIPEPELEDGSED